MRFRFTVTFKVDTKPEYYPEDARTLEAMVKIEEAHAQDFERLYFLEE